MNIKKYRSAIWALVCALGAGGAGYGIYATFIRQPEAPAPITGKVEEDILQLTAKQVEEVQPHTIDEGTFQNEKMAVGNIDFDQTTSVQVFSPYQGKIARVLVNAGDDVSKGQVLYTVFVPDIAQAASNLISADGVLRAANETLKRAKLLVETRSISPKEYEQNASDQQAAEAAFKAAKVSMQLFGINEADIDQMLTSRRVDLEMPVRSPIAGRVVTRSASPGLLVQPGNTPAPITVADLKKMWLLANVPEAEVADYKTGQAIIMTTSAYPDKEFTGTVKYVGDSSDPNTHRILVRSDIDDPQHLLRAQMLADFRIKTSQPRKSVYLPIDALTRENDGSMIAWVQVSPVRFKRVTVKIGLTQGDQVEIVEGISPGQVVATHKGLFLDNLYALTSN
jgi:cobalt-zinc-cadmium efflux system membrane fusion protein